MRAGIQSPDIMYMYDIRQMSNRVYKKTGTCMYMVTDNYLIQLHMERSINTGEGTPIFIHWMFLARYIP